MKVRKENLPREKLRFFIEILTLGNSNLESGGNRLSPLNVIVILRVLSVEAKVKAERESSFDNPTMFVR